MIKTPYFDTFVHIKQKMGKTFAYLAELRVRVCMCAQKYIHFYIVLSFFACACVKGV